MYMQYNCEWTTKTLFGCNDSLMLVYRDSQQHSLPRSQLDQQ
jgi:hypothetical protein